MAVSISAKQIWAMEESKLVIPVIAAPGAEVPVHLMSRNWLRYPEQRAQLLADIAASNEIPSPSVPARAAQCDTVPNLPQNHITRPELVAKLREIVFKDGRRYQHRSLRAEGDPVTVDGRGPESVDRF